MIRIKPIDQMPNFPFKTLSGVPWPNADTPNKRFSMLVFYRGIQCSYCEKYIKTLQQWLPEFQQRNVEVIAISADSLDRAEQSQREWQLKDLELGYELDIESARLLGLYVSTAIREAEMEYFCEPGIFLISPDNTLFTAWIQAYPHARPHFEEIIGCIDFIEQYKRPPRGNA